MNSTLKQAALRPRRQARVQYVSLIGADWAPPVKSKAAEAKAGAPMRAGGLREGEQQGESGARRRQECEYARENASVVRTNVYRWMMKSRNH